MAMMERPSVEKLPEGGVYWEHRFPEFYLKAYVPATTIDGQVNNYTFRAPLLLVFEEQRMDKEQAIAFAKQHELDRIASRVDSSVLFVYPTCEGGWKNADEELYRGVIKEVRMVPDYDDGIASVTDFFTREFKGYFIRGAIFRADIFSFGASADYVATHLLKTLQGEYLWGPGEITPAMCYLENLSVKPVVERKDIVVISAQNDSSLEEAFGECENFVHHEKAPAGFLKDFDGFIWMFKMWCGNMEIEPDFDELDMTEEAGSVTVKTSSNNMGKFKGSKEHKVGYFAYYNNSLMKQDKVPLLLGFHGGGDSAMFLTFVSGWYDIAHKYDFLYVALENHQDIPAEEVVQVIEHLKEKYPVDASRIYASGFSMGSGKTWDMYQEYPEIFAGLAPNSALFPVRNNPFSPDLGDKLNETVSVPIFYTGGECSFVTELPCQAEQGLERIQYAARVNKLKKAFPYSFAEKEKWEDPIWSVSGDRIEKIRDESRDSTLTIHYFDSEDGVCRTAFASISGQVHECRHHTIENAWKFISQFRREE